MIILEIHINVSYKLPFVNLSKVPKFSSIFCEFFITTDHQFNRCSKFSEKLNISNPLIAVKMLILNTYSYDKRNNVVDYEILWFIMQNAPTSIQTNDTYCLLYLFIDVFGNKIIHDKWISIFFCLKMKQSKVVGGNWINNVHWDKNLLLLSKYEQIN